MHIVPVASGKGGVGKTLYTANLGIALVKAGQKVLLIDLDLGGSNLHLVLGIRRVERSIGHFINNTSLRLSDIIMKTEYRGLDFVPGDSEIPGLANLHTSQKRRLLNHIQKMDYDYVILDLGAGSHINTLDFFLTSGRGIILTTPTPTAMVNAYLFLKNSVFRIMEKTFKKGTPAEQYFRTILKDAESVQRIYIMELITEITEIDPKSAQLFMAALRRFQPRIILNMLEDPKDSEKANRLRRSIQQYLGMDVEHLGVMYRDELQDIALSSRLPIIAYKPNSVLSQAIFRIADKMLSDDRGKNDDSPISFEELDESFDTAELEAEVDYQSKMEYVEELLHSGALTPGDLVEAVKTQQWEINQLKKENMLLKSKILKAAQKGIRF